MKEHRTCQTLRQKLRVNTVQVIPAAVFAYKTAEFVQATGLAGLPMARDKLYRRVRFILADMALDLQPEPFQIRRIRIK